MFLVKNKISFSAFKKVRKAIVFQGLFCLFSACSGSDSGWGNTITKQVSQPDSLLEVDSVVVNFMANYHIPGLSIAISKDGKLLYAKGYGYADMSAKKEVTRNSLFRIGQISQTITAVAIMKLIQDGKLSLEATVFGKEGILGTKYGNSPFASKITDVTVNELLHHTCGGWSGDDDRMDDPKFRDTSITREQLLTWTLDNIPLRNIPGTNYGFSNFGYFVLGRIIEKISKQPYADFVKDSILEPAGISNMQLAGNFGDRKKNEVTNYKDLSFPPYNGELDEEFCFFRADACSGWIASATDLLKIIDKVDGFSSKDDILDSATRQTMLSSSKANAHFACGWFLNSDFKNRFFISQHFGQTSEIANASNGLSWSILVNTSRPADEEYLGNLDGIVWRIINNPAGKLHTKYL